MIIHLKNLYRGNHAYSEFARELVDETKKRLKIDSDREAIEILYLQLYSIGLVDELDLYELTQISKG